jgi:hypothetical protein
MVYAFNKRVKEAILLELKVLEINKSLLGDAHPETVQSYKRTGLLEF